ncbi:unnamed protein product [Ceratitis capitata]|uniref:(Mediterranean fruit fly) hypothetical protein n=1 Tax=Ceratitis capitata TaxID=7213 RepID=A0A811TXW8_CERCA|nr:unnamed protein product [Ceratitis capitata]
MQHFYLVLMMKLICCVARLWQSLSACLFVFLFIAVTVASYLAVVVVATLLAMSNRLFSRFYKHILFSLALKFDCMLVVPTACTHTHAHIHLHTATHTCTQNK